MKYQIKIEKLIWSNNIKLCYQRLKSGVSYQSLIENKNNDEFINKNLICEELSSKSKGEIIYLNVLRPNEANPEQSIQSDMCSPDSILISRKSGENLLISTPNKINIFLSTSLSSSSSGSKRPSMK